MENTGHIAFGYAQLFLFLVLLPTICNIIKYTIDAFSDTKYIPSIDESPVYVPTGNISYYTGDHIYKGDHINGTKTVNQQIIPATCARPIKQKKKPKITTKPKLDLNKAFGIEQVQETSLEIKENTAKALKNLGFKTVEAKKIVRKLCINKCYSKEEDLISDAIRNIKND